MENIIKTRTSGLIMVVRVFAAMRNLLGVLGIVAVVCKWE
jgi:hypothetical protein